MAAFTFSAQHTMHVCNSVCYWSGHTMYAICLTTVTSALQSEWEWHALVDRFHACLLYSFTTVQISASHSLFTHWMRMGLSAFTACWMTETRFTRQEIDERSTAAERTWLHPSMTTQRNACLLKISSILENGAIGQFAIIVSYHAKQSWRTWIIQNTASTCVLYSYLCACALQCHLVYMFRPICQFANCAAQSANFPENCLICKSCQPISL